MLFDKVMFCLMLVLVLLGVVLTSVSPDGVHMYWLVLIVLFSVLAMIAGRVKASSNHEQPRRIFKTRLLHWLGTLGVASSLYAFLQEGSLAEEETGLMVLLILALSTFIDGLRIGWLFSLVGVFLLGIALIALYVQKVLLYSLLLAGVMLGIMFMGCKVRA